MDENRLMDIETKLAYQEKTVKELNEVVCEQQKEIERLGAVCEKLLKISREQAMGIDAPANEKPPHY
ncbi:MAG: SlyX family protein [Desulfobacter sp.]|nr:MAG: SlyX family protein [Desulfobacter sp.]